MTIFQRDICNKPDWLNGAVTEDMVCAGNENGVIDACSVSTFLITLFSTTVKSGLTVSGLTGFSGLTGQDARSLQISYPLPWEDSGLTGLSVQRFWSLQTDSTVFLPV